MLLMWLRVMGYERIDHANEVMISQLTFLCRLDIFVKIEPKYVSCFKILGSSLYFGEK